MAPKAPREEAQIGAVLWVRDHGDWRAIVVDRVVDSAKGPKVYYHDFYTRENKSECLLRDGYRARHA